MIRRLAYDEFRTMYQSRIMADFPRAERRPLPVIRQLYRQNRYVCLVLEEEGQIAAYASFICDEAVNSIFLDYYAVDKNQRGGGVGSRFLAQLPQQWPGKHGIILECETPNTPGISDEEKQTRQRRIAFYRRGGAHMTKLLWRAFGVEYNILWLPIEKHASQRKERVTQRKIAHDLLALYALALPKVIKTLCTRLRREGQD